MHPIRAWRVFWRDLPVIEVTHIGKYVDGWAPHEKRARIETSFFYPGRAHYLDPGDKRDHWSDNGRMTVVQDYSVSMDLGSSLLAHPEVPGDRP